MSIVPTTFAFLKGGKTSLKIGTKGGDRTFSLKGADASKGQSGAQKGGLDNFGLLSPATIL